MSSDDFTASADDWEFPSADVSALDVPPELPELAAPLELFAPDALPEPDVPPALPVLFALVELPEPDVLLALDALPALPALPELIELLVLLVPPELLELAVLLELLLSSSSLSPSMMPYSSTVRERAATCSLSAYNSSVKLLKDMLLVPLAPSE